jgi:hypothetical protein
MADINEYAAITGRWIKEDGTLVNIADMVETIYNQTTSNYVGYSTDVKPPAGVQKGASFLELDTKDVYIYDSTKWVMI